MPSPGRSKKWKPRDESYVDGLNRLKKESNYEKYKALSTQFVIHGIADSGEPVHYLTMRYFPPIGSKVPVKYEPAKLIEKLERSSYDSRLQPVPKPAPHTAIPAYSDVNWTELEDSGDFRSDLQWAYANAMKSDIAPEDIPSSGAALLWSYAQDSRKEFIAQVTRLLGKESEKAIDAEKIWIDDKRKQLELIELLLTEEED